MQNLTQQILQALRSCVSDKLPGSVDTAGPGLGTTLRRKAVVLLDSITGCLSSCDPDIVFA